ncbi:MAG: hypothetical protein ACKVOH_02820 [Chlamydiales bacterium]
MSSPPPGYDDESTVPKSRLKNLLGVIEDELTTIQLIFTQAVSGEYYDRGKDLSGEFWGLRFTATELGSEYIFLIEKLIEDYGQFNKIPDEGKLEQLFADVKSIQLLLTT